MKKPTKSRKQVSNTGLSINSFWPKTDNQGKVFDLYQEDKNLLLYGTAGTGKTFLSLYLSLKEILSGNSCRKKLIIYRTAQPTKQIGFLPGDEKEKAAVYEAPYRGLCEVLFGRADAYEVLKQRGVIDFRLTSFVGGTTIDNAIILIDEVQNMSTVEWFHVLSRTGLNSKVMLCGDSKQDVLTNKRFNETSGFQELLKVSEDIPSMESVQFNIDDIVRSGFVRELIESMEKHGL